MKNHTGGCSENIEHLENWMNEIESKPISSPTIEKKKIDEWDKREEKGFRKYSTYKIRISKR